MDPRISPVTLLLVVLAYFAVLMLISAVTSRRASNELFFIGERKSPWYLVAIGMIGATLSGVTFISIPGWVQGDQFSYMQMVLGYLLGYFIIATVLMPMYYRLGLTSIYAYLEQRFGRISYKTGAAYFLLSRTIGAAFRLYLVALVLDAFVMGPLGIGFSATVAIAIVLIWIYTFRGGIRTIIFTDTFQTVFMLTAVVASIVSLCSLMDSNIGDMITRVQESEMSQIFHWESGWSDKQNFFKRFLAGAFIALTMTGLDQDMMQKNLSCKSLGDAQKNMFSFSIILVAAKLIFLFLGAVLYLYMADQNIEMPTRVVGGELKIATDLVYPTIAMEYLPVGVSIIFILGLVAAAYSSADSALTALTTSFCIDFLDFEKRSDEHLPSATASVVEGGKRSVDQMQKRQRLYVHVGFSVLLYVVILFFYSLQNDAIIAEIFKAAGYTYGPLLGLYAFGFLTKRQVTDKYVWLVCLLSPILTYLIVQNSTFLLGGYKFDFEHLILNGFLTFVGLWITGMIRRARKR